MFTDSKLTLKLDKKNKSLGQILKANQQFDLGITKQVLGETR